MRFETYFRKKKKGGGETEKIKPGSLEAYSEFNKEPVGELLEKRRREAEEMEKRQKERTEKLKELKEKGRTHIK